jgi:choline dehydrogenase-like flavoprotein
LAPVLLGDAFESLGPLAGEELSPKLKAPLLRYVSEKPKLLAEDTCHGFHPVQSFAQGGLSNAWGAGVLRYNGRDLDGFPISAADLEPYYDELTAHMGINGATQDDLTSYLGSSAGLQPPFPLSPIVARFLRRYEKRRTVLNRRGVFVGRQRLAILSRPHRGRLPYRAFGQDFFYGPIEGIYSALFTIQELVRGGALQYQPGVMVTAFNETADGVVVTAAEVRTGEERVFRAARLVLAAGAINTARVVLQSHQDRTTSLPLLDNPISFIPCIDFLSIGAALDPHAYIGAELLMLFPGASPNRPLQASLYGLMGPLRTDLLREFPLSMRDNLSACRFLVPALLMLQVFYPDEPCPQSRLRLSADRQLEIVREGRLVENRDKQICAVLRRLGYFAVPQLCVHPAPGSSIHYAGTLPMTLNPSGPYQTDAWGRLGASTRVYVADASVFPSLPAKNHTLTLMALALRLGRHVKSTLGS